MKAQALLSRWREKVFALMVQLKTQELGQAEATGLLRRKVCAGAGGMPGSPPGSEGQGGSGDGLEQRGRELCPGSGWNGALKTSAPCSTADGKANKALGIIKGSTKKYK